MSAHICSYYTNLNATGLIWVADLANYSWVKISDVDCLSGYPTGETNN